MKTTERFSRVIAASAVLVGLLACSRDGVPAPQARASLGDDVRKPIEEALAAYEEIRASLAQDEADGVAAAAGRIEAAARSASARAPATLRPHLEGAAAAAATLAGLPATDLEAVRRAFGDLSRPLVELIAAEPSLAAGRRVFECGMAQGYNKWIQTTAEVSNPYMGTKMLACGSASSWK